MPVVLTNADIRRMLESYTRSSKAANAGSIAKLYAKDASIFVSGRCIARGRDAIRTSLMQEFSDAERVAPTVSIGRIILHEGDQLSTVEETFSVPNGDSGQVLMMVGIEEDQVRILEEWIFIDTD